MATMVDSGIPYVAGQQAQPEITHNDALNMLWVLANGVLDRGINDPPGAPAQGDVYILGTAPTGAWFGRPNRVAAWFGTAWVFLPGNDSSGTPIAMGARQEGLTVWVRDENAHCVWNGAAWVNLEVAESIELFVGGAVPTSTLLFQKVAVRPFALNDDFLNSRGFAVTAPAVGAASLDVERNGVVIGTITFAIATQTATFATIGGGQENFAAGDRLGIRSQAAMNGIANVSIALLAFRT